MSTAPPSTRPERSAEEAPTQTQSSSGVYSNKNQSWYRNLCRPGDPPMSEDPKQVSPSPQRLQLQLHFQREYQQRQELQKNCRQEWWQKKSGGPAYAAPSPSNYRTPSPAHKFHATAGSAASPAYYQSGPYPPPPHPHLYHPHQPMPRPATQQQSARGYYTPGAATGDSRAASSENRRLVERDLVDREREKMIRTAQVIKLDAEKRIRQAKRQMAATSSSSGEQDNTQRLLIQLLKEQDLAQKLQASNRPPPQPVTPVQHLSADLQYRLATLLQAYQPTQQMSVGYQRRWQEQIATYKGMLQEYRRGNFYQSHQKAKRLLQLLLQKEQASTQVRLPPPYYGPPPQQPPVYPTQHAGHAQPLYRTPLPHYANRSRRDPRLNRSSQQYQTPTYDVTPRLNQSSCQYSEQDLTSEIIYQEEAATKTGSIARRNSTPRKQGEDVPAALGGDARSEEAWKQESQHHAKAAADYQPQKDQQPVEVPKDRGIAETSTQTANDEQYGSENVPGLKEQQHEWEQLQQRSRRHRRGRFRRSSEDGMESMQAKPVNGAHREELSAAPLGFKAKHLTEDPKLHKNIGMKHDITPSNGESHTFPDNEVQQKTLNDLSGSDVRARTPFKAPNNADHKKTDHRAEIISKDIRQTTAQNNPSVLSAEIWTCVDGMMSKSDSTDRIPRITNKNVIDYHTKSTDNENKGKILNGKETAAHKQDQLPSRPESLKSTNDAEAKSTSAEVTEKDPSLEKKQSTEKDPKESGSSPGQALPSKQAISEKAQQADDRAKVKSRRQLSEPLQSRAKQQPSPQTRPHPPLQRQSSRGSQPPYHDPPSQRPLRPQPPPRAARQSTPSSRQSSVNLHQVSDSCSPTQTSQKPAEVLPAPTETRNANTGTKSSDSAILKSQSLDSMVGKSDGAKSQGGAASKPAGGRRSPGNTYVIRNSGQRFASKPPPGGVARSQDSGSSQSKNPSPKSTASKSPPEDAGKTEVSPPSAKSRRRRYRRKPWSKEDDSFQAMSRSSSAPHGQPRYQDRPRDYGQQPAWLSPSSGRWSRPRYSPRDGQPRRRPYQWDEARTVPVKKWKDVGHHGGASPPTGSSNEEQPRGGFGKKGRASPEPRQPTPEKGQRAADNALHAQSEEQNPSNDSVIEEPTAEDGAQEMLEQTSAVVRQDSDGGGEHQSEGTTKTGDIEDGHEKRPSETTQKTKDTEADRNTLQAGPALLDGKSGVSKGLTSRTEPACGKEGTPMEPLAAAGDVEEPRRVMREKPETLLEHVLSVLGRKAARDALEDDDEEEAEEGEDGAAPLQTLHSPKSERISGTQNATESITQTSPVTFNAWVNESSQEQALARDDKHVERATDPHQADGGVLEDVGPASPGGVTPEAAANDQTTQTDISLATATLSPAFLTPCARLVRLDDMEDWRSLDDQQKDEPRVGEPPGHQQEASVGDDQPRPLTAEPELTTRTTDEPSSENRHLTSDSQTVTSGDSQAVTSGDSQAVTSGDSQAVTSGDSQAVTTGDSQAVTSEETRLHKGEAGEDDGNLCQGERKTADVESSDHSSKTEARQQSGGNISTSLPGANNVGNTRHDDGEGTQKPVGVPEHETRTPSDTHVGLTEENGEAPEESAGLHEPSGKQGLSAEDELGIAIPRSEPMEEVGGAVETSKDVSASESEPECVQINEVRVETGNTLPADCPVDIEKKCAMENQQPETSQTEELKPFESRALHNQSSPNRHKIFGDMDESLASVCEEQNPQSSAGIDRESVAPENEPACSEDAGDENSPSKNWRVVNNQPGAGTVSSTCPSERCVHETAAAVVPLSTLAHSAAARFSSVDLLCPGPETDLTKSEDSRDRNESTASATSLTEDDLDLHESQVCGASSPGTLDSECQTVWSSAGRALCKSTLMDRERKLTSSGKKKSVSFLLDGGSGDDAERPAPRREGCEPSGVVMKSPPADKMFNWDSDSESVLMAAICPVCSRPLAPDSLGNSHLDSGEVLFDKLTACGYF